MAQEHKGFPVAVRLLSTDIVSDKILPGDVMVVKEDGKVLATCSVDFPGEWEFVECYSEFDGFSGQDLGRYRYVFRFWDETRGESVAFDADDPIQDFGVTC